MRTSSIPSVSSLRIQRGGVMYRRLQIPPNSMGFADCESSPTPRPTPLSIRRLRVPPICMGFAPCDSMPTPYDTTLPPPPQFNHSSTLERRLNPTSPVPQTNVLERRTVACLWHTQLRWIACLIQTSRHQKWNQPSSQGELTFFAWPQLKA